MRTDAAMRVRAYIFSEETFQSDQVTFLRRADKGVQQTLVVVRPDGRATVIRDMFTGTRDELARVSFLHVQGLRVWARPAA